MSIECVRYCVEGLHQRRITPNFSSIMQSSFEPFAFLLLALLASSAYALPILPSHTTHPFAILSPDTTSVSPRISCINLKGQSICERFEIRIPLQEFTASSLYTRPFNSVKGSELLSAEDRQIHRIMEAKEGEIRVSDEQPWMTPDIQVVLWFIFLCCLMEGTLSGFRW